jgi:hypothetical protein
LGDQTSVDHALPRRFFGEPIAPGYRIDARASVENRATTINLPVP